MLAPPAPATTRAIAFTSRTVDVAWDGDDGAGSGVSTYDVDVRQTGSPVSSAAATGPPLLRGTAR